MFKSKWVRRYLKLAEHVADWSKDPSTKVGAVIIGPGNRPVSFGFNGFHRGADDSMSNYADKEYKHRHIIHAEVNAILNAQCSLQGCEIYVTHPPCQHCAGVIVQVGITTVYCNRPDEKFMNRWKLEDTVNLLQSKGISLKII